MKCANKKSEGKVTKGKTGRAETISRDTGEGPSPQGRTETDKCEVSTIS